MPRSWARSVVITILAIFACNVPAGALAQPSPYPLTRAQPLRVIPAGTLLEIDRVLTKDGFKPGFVKVHYWPDEAFHVAVESRTKIVGRFASAVMLRLGADGVRIIERDEEIAKMPLLHFEPTIERTMMVPTLQFQPLFNPGFNYPRLNSIEMPELLRKPQPERNRQ